MSVATDPYLFDRPVTIDRSWLASPALCQGLGTPTSADSLSALIGTWSTERAADDVSFDRIWDPLDACHGRGGFEYQPSAAPAAPSAMARLRELALQPPTIAEVSERVQRDLARLVDGLPD